MNEKTTNKDPSNELRSFDNAAGSDRVSPSEDRQSRIQKSQISAFQSIKNKKISVIQCSCFLSIRSEIG